MLVWLVPRKAAESCWAVIISSYIGSRSVPSGQAAVAAGLTYVKLPAKHTWQYAATHQLWPSDMESIDLQPSAVCLAETDQNLGNNRPCMDALKKLLWRDKTCPGCT